MSREIPLTGESLLDQFNNAHARISGEGHRYSVKGREKVFGDVAECFGLSWAAAMTDRDGNRQLGAFDEKGVLVPYAMVNGKGVVEVAGGASEDAMRAMVARIGHHVDPAPAKQGETMMHYSSRRGPVKVF